jgi:hypothetical protein
VSAFVTGYIVAFIVLAAAFGWVFTSRMDVALTSCAAHRYNGAMVDWHGKIYCVRGAQGVDVVIALEYLEGQ